MKARLVVILVVLCAAVMALGRVQSRSRDQVRTTGRTAAAAILTPTIPFDVMNGANATQTDYYNFGWQSFVALNWPALGGGENAQPDPNQKIGATDPATSLPLPVVWQGYKDPRLVFLAGATPPQPWNSASSPPPPSNCPPLPGGVQPRLVLNSLAKTSPEGLSELNEAGFNPHVTPHGPLIDQNGSYVLYQQAMNQSEFTYIVNQQYFNADTQKAQVANGTFVPPPKGNESWIPTLPSWAQQGATEIKAAWRILDPTQDIVTRYFRMPGYFVQPDGTCTAVTFGLVGLHILRLTPVTGSTWFWASFEQVDNVQVNGSFTRPNGKPLTPSFNPGPKGDPPPPYPLGYTYEPKPVESGQPLPQDAPVDVSRYTAIPAEVQVINALYQAALTGTVFQHYEMVNVLNPNPTGTANPPCAVPGSTTQFPNICTFANTTLETYAQPLSCISCHGYATPVGGTIPNNQIFTFFLQHAQSRTGAAKPLVRFAPRPLRQIRRMQDR